MRSGPWRPWRLCPQTRTGEKSTYTGVSIAALLEQAAPAAGDGFSSEVALDEVLSCADGIASFRNQGGFSIGMPGFSGKLQVKAVVEIQVK